MNKINTRIKRTLVTAGLASSVALLNAVEQPKEGVKNNPLLTHSALLFAAPDFSCILETDYQTHCGPQTATHFRQYHRGI